MPRRTDFQAAITYTGQRIAGPVTVSYKIDGVRLLSRGGKIVTRNDKVPPGLKRALTDEADSLIHFMQDVELYTGKFADVQGPISRHEPDKDIFGTEHVYSLDPLDPRLFINTFDGLEKNDTRIQELLISACNLGYEGLVLRTADRWYRVKPSATADVFVTGYFEQLDTSKRPKDQLGGFCTNYGKVTAFTDEARVQLWKNPEQYIGKLMTVQYKELYDSGSFRYAVKFLHFRDDKDTESFDTKNT